MSYPKFERAKLANPELTQLLESLMTYISNQASIGQTFIVPKLAAAVLKLNDGEAYVLLEILANAEILDRVFNVYCKRTGMLLATVHSVEQLSQVPDCDYCDVRHESRELRLELAFELNQGSNGFQKAA